MQTKIDKLRTTPDRHTRLASKLLPALCLALTLHGQTFSSGSTGADGDLIVNTPGVTTFTATPVGGGPIYNFKSIQIAAGSTLKLSGAVFSNPLYFLAQNAVTIAGTLDLSGQNGVVPTNSALRVATLPGPGGYAGGPGTLGGIPALPGFGPLGGTVTGGCIGNGGPGGFSGSQFLVPLVGGSGGAGNTGNGGGGGGALLIASSVSITVTGTITAAGGSATLGAGAGAGAGGAIRLVAPLLAGTGSITAAAGAGSFSTCNGGLGVVRLEFFQSTFTGTTGGTLYTATPVNLFLPAVGSQPTIVVTSIGGINVPPSPTGSFTVPDVLLNSTSPLTVNIQAVNVPLGTVPIVYFSTQNFPDQKINANAGLSGTLASSTTTATVTLKQGYSVGFVTATWSQ